MRHPWTPLVLAAGILAVSAASIFVRFAQREADSLVIAAGRLALATLVLAPIALARHRGALRALAMAAYLLVGRRLRARMALVPYVFVVYGAAAVVLVVAVALTGRRVTGLGASAWGWIALLALVPQLIGHTAFNWALRHLRATPVAVVLFGEPVGAAVLAWIVLGETPDAVRIAGALVVLAGVFLAARASGDSEPSAGPGISARLD